MDKLYSRIGIGVDATGAYSFGFACLESSRNHDLNLVLWSKEQLSAVLGESPGSGR